MNCVHRTGSAYGPRTGAWEMTCAKVLTQSVSIYIKSICSHQSNSRRLFTHWWPLPPPKKKRDFWPGRWHGFNYSMTFIDLTLHQQWRCGIRPDAISQVECQRTGLSHRLFDQFVYIFVRNVLFVHLRIFRMTLVDFSGPTGIFISFPWSQRGCGSRSHENWASKLRAFYLKKQSWNSTRHKLPRTASDHQIFLRINFVNFGYKSCLTRLKWVLVSHCIQKSDQQKPCRFRIEMNFRVHYINVGVTFVFLSCLLVLLFSALNVGTTRF